MSSTTISIVPPTSDSPHPLQSEKSYHNPSEPLQITFSTADAQKTDSLKLSYLLPGNPPQLKEETLKTKGKASDTLQYKKFPKELASPCIRVEFKDDASPVLVRLQTEEMENFYNEVLQVEQSRFLVDEWKIDGLQWMNGMILMDRDVALHWTKQDESKQTPEEQQQEEENKDTDENNPAESSPEDAVQQQDYIFILAVSQNVRQEFITESSLGAQFDDPADESSQEGEDSPLQVYKENHLLSKGQLKQDIYDTFAKTALRPVRLTDESDIRVLSKIRIETDATQKNTSHQQTIHLPKITAEDKVEQIIIAYKRGSSMENDTPTSMLVQRISDVLPVYLRQRALEERKNDPDAMQITIDHNARLLSLHEDSGKVIGGQGIVVEFNVIETLKETCHVGDQISMWFVPEGAPENADGQCHTSHDTHGQTYSRVRFRLPSSDAGQIYFTYLQRGAPDVSNWIYRTESFSISPKESLPDNPISEAYIQKCRDAGVKVNSMIVKNLRNGTFSSPEKCIDLANNYLSRRGFTPVLEIICEHFATDCHHLILKGNGLRNAEVLLLCDRLRDANVSLNHLDLRDNVISSTEAQPGVMERLRGYITEENRQLTQFDLQQTKLTREQIDEIETLLEENRRFTEEQEEGSVGQDEANE